MVGGGNIGYQVAKELDTQAGRYSLSLIEASPERARTIAEKLDRSIVLHGSGLSPELLAEAGIRQADLVLALTNDDQVNILTNMLALQEGCQRGLCLINDNSFQNLAELGYGGATVRDITRRTDLALRAKSVNTR